MNDTDAAQCDHEWEEEFLPDPFSLGAVIPAGHAICIKCLETLEGEASR